MTDLVKYDDKLLQEVLKAITAGCNNHQIIQYLNYNKIDITAAELPDYILKAYEYYLNLSVIDKDYQIGKAIERLNNLYFNAFKIQDYKTCLAIQKEINELVLKVKPGKKEKRDFKFDGFIKINKESLADGK